MTDYFSALDLDPNELLRLNDEEARKTVERAYDKLVSTANQGDASENPRAEVWADAKDALCDPVRRTHHAEKLGYQVDDSEPAHRPQNQPPPHQPPRPSRNSGGAPWWGAAFVAASGVLLYLFGAGALLDEPGTLIFWLGSFLMVRTITKTTRQAIVSTLIVGFLGTLLASWSYHGFSQVVASWNAPPTGVASGPTHRTRSPPRQSPGIDRAKGNAPGVVRGAHAAGIHPRSGADSDRRRRHPPA